MCQGQYIYIKTDTIYENIYKVQNEFKYYYFPIFSKRNKILFRKILRTKSIKLGSQSQVIFVIYYDS